MPHPQQRAGAGRLQAPSPSPTFGTGPRPFTERPQRTVKPLGFETPIRDSRARLELALIHAEEDKAKTEAAKRKKAEIEARLAEPLEKAKAEGVAEGFRARRDFTPDISTSPGQSFGASGVFPSGSREGLATATGVRGISEGHTELSRAAGIARDPDFAKAVEAGRAAPYLGGGGEASPGERIALIQQDTSVLRTEGQQELQNIRDAAAAARQQVTEGGLDERQAVTVEVQIASNGLKARIDLLKQRIDANRFDRNFWPGLNKELERQLQETEATLQQYEFMGRAAGVSAPTAAPEAAAGGDLRAQALAMIEAEGFTDPTEEEIGEVMADIQGR